MPRLRSEKMAPEARAESEDEDLAQSDTADEEFTPQTKKDVGRLKQTKGLKRGLRQPLEPGIEFKAYLSEATLAFTAFDLDKAELAILEALRLNPEMFQAHNLLAEIHLARDDGQKALVATWNGAHTRPRDPAVWQRLANMIMQFEEDSSVSSQKKLIYCYSRILTIDKDRSEVRFQRATLNASLGHKRKAIMDLELILRMHPADSAVLRELAKTYHELGAPDQALTHYYAALPILQSQDFPDENEFNWSDANIVAELLLSAQDYDNGLVEIKRISRWLLGRKAENLWDRYTQDDREWDRDHLPRRTLVEDFQARESDSHLYGIGLPLELRIKLGLFRLLSREEDLAEAMKHFEWLRKARASDGTWDSYFDHYREVGMALKIKSHFSEALEFLKPIMDLEVRKDLRLWLSLALCLVQCDLLEDAETSYRSILEMWPNDLEANTAVMKLGKLQNDGAANATVKREMFLTHIESSVQDADENSASNTSLLAREALQIHKKTRTSKPSNAEPSNHNITTARYNDLQKAWITLEAQQRTIKDDRIPAICALRASLRILVAQNSLRSKQASATADESDQLSSEQHVHSAHQSIAVDNSLVPLSLVGQIPFTASEDLLVYALESAKAYDAPECKRALLIAMNADWSSTDQGTIFLRHLCSLACALHLKDDDAICQIARWFVMEYQFATDTYRLFTAVNRLCHTDNIYFNASPTQKFVLRQVKAVDFPLDGANKRKSLYDEKASLKVKKDGQLQPAKDLDTSLLMLYGHILYAGKSFSYAINYFLRALAADPTNAAIKFSIGLAYIHWSMKRQAENRHYIIAQGLSFLSQYYKRQQRDGDPLFICAADYNMGRAFHLLGLNQLAVRYYEKCLAHGKSLCKQQTSDNHYAHEAALGLQAIFVASRNFEKASRLTQDILVL